MYEVSLIRYLYVLLCRIAAPFKGAMQQVLDPGTQLAKPERASASSVPDGRCQVSLFTISEYSSRRRPTSPGSLDFLPDKSSSSIAR